MATQPVAPSPARPLPIAPTEEEWRAMSLVERERLLVKVLDALSDPRSAMSEGRPHKKVKTRSLDMLGLHFGAVGRVVYLAEEMAVLYPGEEVFTPDVLAVVDVAEPEDDERMAWVVVDEGKGLDFVLEVLHRGDRTKDLVENVERYARLGIPEYFIYDRAQQRIRGYRLAVDDAGSSAKAPGARRYQTIVPQGGRYSSNVLGLDLVIEGGSLRFFNGMAELFGSADLIRRLSRMVGERESKAEQAESRADLAETKAEQAQTRASLAIVGLRTGVLAALDARGLVVEEGLRARVLSCDDPTLLQRWLLRALSAASAAEVFSDETR
ncbi:MAG: Uma2 family endonuclease [Byssovorax sp.]